MKKIVMLAVLGVLGFGGAFASTWFMKHKNRPKAPPAAEAPVEKVSIDDQLAENPPTSSRLSLKEKQLDETVSLLQEQQEACRQRQSELDQREKRLLMTQDLLRKQALELETTRLQLAAQLAAIKDDQARLDSARTVISQQEKVNIKKTAQIYEKMDPASSSKIVEGMCSNNQSDDAVKILHFMSDRAAAKLLGEMQDKAVVAKLVEKLKNVTEG